MKNSTKRSLTGLLLVATLACMAGCGNSRSKKPEYEDIIGYRTANYLGRVAAEAELTIREAQKLYDEACEKQMIADSVSAKDTISQYESEYREAIDLINKAHIMPYDDSGYPDYDYYNARMDSLAEKYDLTIKIYERAEEELETARGTYVRKAEEELDNAKHNRRKIATYRCISNTPPEERTKEYSVILNNVYDFCRRAERQGWGYNISSRLVEYIENIREEEVAE